MTADELKAVEDFCVGHELYGEIVWTGKTDVTGLNLDNLIEFGESSVEVYPDGDDKPEPGQQLNKKANVKLFKCWPVSKKTRRREKPKSKKAIMKYEDSLKSVTKTMGANFLEYDAEKGYWCFVVESF